MKKLIKLSNSDKASILEFLSKQDMVKYMFLVSDIEGYDLETKDVALYVSKDNDLVENIFLCFYGNLVVFYQKDNFDLNQLKDIMTEYQIKNAICQPEFIPVLEKLASQLNKTVEINRETIMTLDKAEFDQIKAQYPNLEATLIVEKDLAPIIESRKQIKEFNNFSAQALDLNYLLKSLNNGYYGGYVIYKDNKVVSHASYIAKNQKAATIGGVFTLEDYRRKGYSKDCVIKLCDDLLNKNITPTLFFDNPVAGKMYYSLGFKDYGTIIVGLLK
ncbi:GNAT family N-acetyltransferase [Mycoplasma corogypsi]|uniref:GNAT family N-acetyltransferase n=1 Tax=Mycoplasma corogypsi TaxID=2106 RepID=UPI00387328AB